jgi:MFS family permease
MALLAFQLAGIYALGSIADGVKLAGIVSFTAGLMGPLRGNWLDRREMRRGLQISCIFAALLMVGFAVAVALRGSFWTLLVLALGMGFAVAGVWGGFRALLLGAVPSDLLRRAHFAASLMTEIGYGVGPLLVTAVVVVGGVVVVLATMSIVFIAAAIALNWVVPLAATRSRREKTQLPSRPIIFICAIGGLLSFGFGIVESSVPSRMAQYGLNANLGGLFLAVLAVGSVIGGAVVSIVPISSKRPPIIASALFGLFALLIIPSSLAPNGWTFGICLLFVSLMLVPLSGLGVAEIEMRVGAGGRGRIFALYLGAVQVGGGLGVVVSGVLLSWLRPSHIPIVTSSLYVVLAIILVVIGLREGARVSAA